MVPADNPDIPLKIARHRLALVGFCLDIEYTLDMLRGHQLCATLILRQWRWMTAWTMLAKVEPGYYLITAKIFYIPKKNTFCIKDLMKIWCLLGKTGYPFWFDINTLAGIMTALIGSANHRSKWCSSSGRYGLNSRANR
jgi:hypothetical protein